MFWGFLGEFWEVFPRVKGEVFEGEVTSKKGRPVGLNKAQKETLLLK